MTAALFAQQQTKPIPAVGVEIPAADRAELTAGLKHLQAATAKLAKNPLVADVLIYQEAVRNALEYNEFLNVNEVAKAKTLLREGEERAGQLAEGQSPWTTATGLVVRGYISKIDKSVQPYGLVVPPSYSPKAPHRWRLDTWFMGRTETNTQVNFLAERERSPGQFTPRDAIVLHPYGRFCNANKLAGEVDTLEALDAVKHNYPIDENRILMRGFSMGGASAWHFGGHFGGLWAAVAPGAGFSESAQFLHLNMTGANAPSWWEQKLYHMYDITDYSINFFNVPVVEYHGEIDGQKQAGDVMEKRMAEEGLRLIRIEGPQTPHRYHPDSKIIIDRMLDAIAERGREEYPRKIRFTTWTLEYDRMKWVVVDGLQKHWDRARVDAEVEGDSGVKVDTSNVTAFSLEFGPGGSTLDVSRKATVNVDGQKVSVDGPMSDRSWNVHLGKVNGKWQELKVSAALAAGHKVHGLQGPVDDAFMDSFVFVTPTGTPVAPGVAKWVAEEQKHAIGEWRRHMRGEAQVREDKAVTDEDIASSNLVLWGDPGSNAVLARIADKLPVKWGADAVTIGSEKFPAATHAAILVYPNPLNPKKYVVLNSGFTFREFDYLNNARQIPKLPDYAVVDTTTPPNDRFPGKIVEAGFFDEEWNLQAGGGK
jgi:hypothetical protein